MLLVMFFGGMVYGVFLEGLLIGYKKSENLTFSLSGVFGVTSNVRISEVHAIVREHFSTYSFTFLESPNFQTEEMSKNAVCEPRTLLGGGAICIVLPKG